jgi:predicted small integral membrane protein
MKKLGGYMFFFGVGSIILDMLGRQFIILAWIDMWGPQVGWAIRIGLAVVGAVLWLRGNSQESETT